LPATWSPSLAFIIYAIQANIRGSDSLSTAQAFTSLAIISLVTSPAAELLATIPQSASAMGCFARIQKYLLSATREDGRVLNGNGYDTTGISPNTSESNDCIELVSILPKRLGLSSGDAIIFDSATICPSPTASPAVTAASFSIAKGSLTIIVGPVGSGKTTIMKAMLGELRCESGYISVASKRMAYCGQTSWLLNTSIQQSICGLTTGSAIDEGWCGKVMRACALDEDMLLLPDGDRSIIGSKGLTLSGGQKQRLVSNHEMIH